MCVCVCVCVCVHACVSIVASFYVVECPKGDKGASSGFIGNATAPPPVVLWCVMFGAMGSRVMVPRAVVCGCVGSWGCGVWTYGTSWCGF